MSIGDEDFPSPWREKVAAKLTDEGGSAK